MKKIYIAASLFLAIFSQADAQVLNQAAEWPNTAWTVTGTYTEGETTFEADPTTSENFAFDDDDAGFQSDDNIAAESPVIDLTAAFNAGEKSIQVAFQYAYRDYFTSVLRVEYYDATAATWMPWTGEPIPSNSTIFDLFCSSPKTQYFSEALNISNFSASQLSGFKYRIAFEDNIEGAGYAYGFCLDSPTISSLSCGAVSGLTVEADSVTTTSATINWNDATGIGFEYVLDINETDPVGAGTPITENTYTASMLMAGTVYYFHLRVNCESESSEWRTVSFTTLANPPANDDCASAIALTVGSSFDEGVLTTTSVAATVSDFIPSCQSNVSGDVWFSVTVPSDGNLVIETGAVEGSTNTDTVLVAYSGTCDSLLAIDCDDDDSTAGNFSLLELSGLTAGETLYIQALQYGSNPERGEFKVSAYSTTLATSAFSQNAFKAYPNPVKDVLNLSYYKNISSVAVYNLLGQEVFAKSVNANSDQINLSSLSSGTYLVKVAADNEVKTIKVIKE